MKIPVVKNLAAMFAALSVAIIGSLGLSGCGGGDSNGENVIAPESMDQVTIQLFRSFTLELFRLNGTAGNERGAVDYTRYQDEFRYGIDAGNGANLGTTIALPLILTQMTYDYVRTGVDTGRLTITFQNTQVYPWPEANKDNPNGPTAVGDMFWGGRSGVATELVMDILFTEQNGYIGSTTTRVRSGYRYSSTWSDPGPAVNSAFPFDFDTTDAVFSMSTGGGVPSHYDPYGGITDKTPSSAVWTSFQGRTVNFVGSDGVVRRIGHQSTGGIGPEIPDEKFVEESGTLLVDVFDNGSDRVIGVGGTYSYTRTGGDRAKFVIEYNDIIGGVSQKVTIVYEMDFDGLDIGTYLDSSGIVGTFTEDLRQPIP